MALFFDTDWFNAALARVDLERGDLARALGLSETEIAEVWKDQRELSAREVTLIAARLKVPAADVARHAGVSTPVPRQIPDDAAGIGALLGEFAERLERLERGLAEIKTLLLDLRQGR